MTALVGRVLAAFLALFLGDFFGGDFLGEPILL
jgi:hypothetical protein